jgi:hypothetical protein
MNHKIGDRVRIKSRNWINEQLNNSAGVIMFDGCHFTEDMFEYAGKTATITRVTPNRYHFDIDNGTWWWNDWMVEPDYDPCAPLTAEDAVRAMLDGETLYDKNGNKYYWGKILIAGQEGTAFIQMYKGLKFRYNGFFDSLYRSHPKRKRDMTKDEAMAWASGSESLGWIVRCSFEDWDFPRTFGYHEEIKFYQRARLLPDLSGIDESTIQGFEVEE